MLVFAAGMLIGNLADFEFIKFLIPHAGCADSLVIITMTAAEDTLLGTGASGGESVFEAIKFHLLSHFV